MGNLHQKLQRQTAGAESTNSLGAPRIVHDVLRSSGEPLDAATRAYFEPRFSHDFSQVPVHSGSHLSIGQAGDHFEREADRISADVMRSSATSTGPGADLSQVRIHTDPLATQSARAVNALAYTVGRDIVFDSGSYAPETSAGRGLLAHELTHVFQQSHQTPAVVQRAPSDKDLENYAQFIRTNKKIEGKADSKKKALALVDFRVKDQFGPSVGDDNQYLLILELAAGTPSQADLDGILEVLERMGSFDLGKVFNKGRVDLNTLVGLFTGKNKTQLEDFFARRFEGGLKQVQAGTIKPMGAYVQSGVPLASIQIIKDTVAWLKTNKKEAVPFFNDVWSKNKLVLLGEIHYDDVQRQFAADMLAAKGGSDVGLALEIPISQIAEVNHYIQHGAPPKDAKGWWKNDALFKKILDSAKATKTQVIAMDTKASTDRDQHMADEVVKLAKSKSKILVYVGAMHIREFANAALGEKLAAQFGGNSYAIDISHAQISDNIYFMIKAAFPSDKSMGFDIDASPLAKHPDPSAVKKPGMEKTLDGYIYFSTTTAYK